MRTSLYTHRKAEDQSHLHPKATQSKTKTESEEKSCSLRNYVLSQLAQIIQNGSDILSVKLNIKDIFKEPDILTFRWPNNIIEMIGRNNTLNNKGIHWKSTIKST